MRILSFVIFYSCLALLGTPTTCSTNNQTDFLSLIALKKSISDPNGALNSWNQTTNFCAWNGIECGRKHTDRVVAIRLRSQGLVGSLSPHIGNLSFLRFINLRNNTFDGQIPQEIGLLRRLEVIEFSNNSFSGTIPKNMSQCRNLVYLNLMDNNISGTIPQELRVLENLESLGLTGNIFPGHIPQFIGNLTSLGQLSLASCGFNGEVPDSLSQLKRLRMLQLGDNNLSGPIPQGLFNISTMDYFQVLTNSLQGSIPSTVGLTLPHLRVFSLGNNQFSGVVPISLSNATSLEALELSTNYFTGPMPSLVHHSRLHYFLAVGTSIKDDVSFISSLTNCTNLKILSIGDNPLITGSPPNTIGNLSRQLYLLSISETQVVGRIPSSIENLVGLTLLQLHSNNLEGPIPLSIGRLSNLGFLHLGNNMFTGGIPSTFGNLTSITKMYFQENNFSGAIPKSIGNCSKLLELYLPHNNLSGTIPREILVPAISLSLNLSYNAFTGSIPVDVGSLRNLGILDFSNNRLSGLIPNSLGGCTSLERLRLEGNLFEGEIPKGLSSLMGLIDLDLSRNNLSGTIPSFLGDLRLQELNLSFNGLRGKVPMTGLFKNKTAISLEGNKQLCGGILELDLPPCPSSPVSSKKGLSTPLKIVIPIAGVATVLFLVFLLYKRRTPNNDPTALPSFTGIPFLRLSYADLLRATNAFAETNLVGSGRFGSVYKGILDGGTTTIAVKVLKLVVRGASKSFMAECNALRDIRHRNLVKILSVCESIDFQGNDFKALVYEFKANGSLDKWLYYDGGQDQNSDARLGKLDIIERLNIAIDIAQALEYLHCDTDSIIVHGDLKPSNILLDEDMVACVGDFGLSKIISSILPPGESSSSTIGIKGTFGYVPPEYGMTGSVSTKGDVYSYGILVLEMFTNRRPTDDSFRDHENLHNFVSAAFPDRVMEVADTFIRIGPHQNNGKIEECLSSVLGIGLSCSKEMPRDRMSMKNVVHELHKIQKELCG